MSKNDDSDDDKRPDYDEIAARLLRDHAEHFAKIESDSASTPAEDPAGARRRHLLERGKVLLAGRFPHRHLGSPLEPGPLVTDALTDEPALRHARAFAASRTSALVLTGGTGSGKTLAAGWLAREIGGARPRFVRAAELERAGRYDRDLSAWLDERTFLVLDDLGVEYADKGGAFLSLLDQLVDEAYADTSRLVITSNLPPVRLAERVGERVWSRVCEAAMFGECGSRDLRMGGRR